MKKFPVILDLETKYTFRDYDDPKKLGISVVGIYDYKNNQGKVYLETEIPQLFPILEDSSYIIGFNVKSFDLPVLQYYYPGKVHNLPIFDILEDIREKVGKRLALNDIIMATLNKKKSGHGLMAIDYYKEKRWEELKKYCLDDVLLTKELFDFGVEKNEIYYLDERGRVTVKVDWKKYLEESAKKDTHLTLPF
ncbi:ribonuclease H-like domain-containing protein [Candidatus Roizmanbacteria bacterium]|nr:ribonuclease H-like domain-containing protein [Candidatus Roizmanbacteria bacterium]